MTLSETENVSKIAPLEIPIANFSLSGEYDNE